MRVPLRWLREYVDFDLSPEELAQRLTMSGTEVATISRVGAHWERLVIGRVERIERHPNADHLFVAQVRAVGDPVTLVTAAPNLKAGDVVPVVLAGGRLGPDAVVQARPFRGITSQGMLCSGHELGISPDQDHIYVLEPEAPIGQDLRDYLADAVLDIELTPNRPDCTGIVGIAREVAALTGGDLRVPQAPVPSGPRAAADLVHVYVDDPDLCPRYTAAYLEGLAVHESPPWLQRRLFLCGMRPINNLVDVTNYVMLELGQPLHAFDADKLAEATIRVRRARPGERLVTIDGVDRELPADALVIADAAAPVGIAGVMGGLNSEISETTTRVVLESANFSARSIRRTARALRLATEASKRFDKGLDPQLPAPASHRAVELMLQLAGGASAAGLVEVGGPPPAPRRVFFTSADLAGLIGVRYPDDQIRSTLTRLGFRLTEVGGGFQAEVPSWRGDVEGKADIAEEMARIVGYDAIPTALPSGRLPPPAEEPSLRWEETVRTALAAAGLQEVINYSLVDPRAVAKLDADAPYPDVPADDTIPVANPMSIDHSRLRSTLLPSLLSNVGANLRYQPRVWIFELAKVFEGPLDPLPAERRRLAIAMAGPREPRSWAAGSAPTDFFDLKAAVEACFRAVRAPAPTVEPARAPWLHPTRGARVLTSNGREAGLMGQVHPRVAERFDIEGVDVYAAELDLVELLTLAHDEVTVRPLPRYPAVERDLAIVVDETVPHREVQDVIRAAGGALLESVELFDVYRGAPIPSGKRSLAFSLTFRAPDRTLAEEEVVAVVAAIEERLRSQVGASLRGPS